MQGISTGWRRGALGQRCGQGCTTQYQGKVIEEGDRVLHCDALRKNVTRKKEDAH